MFKVKTNHISSAALLFSSFIIASTAQAAITSYGVTLFEDYTQINNAGSATPTSVFPLASINGANAADIVAARWKSPVSAFSDFYLVAQPALYYGSNGTFTTVAAMQAQFPSGSWPYQVTAGASAGNATLAVPAYDFPSEVPFLINGTYAGLQLTTAGVDAPVQLKTWSSNNPLTTVRSSGYQIIDLTNTSHYEYGDSGTNSWGGAPIPAAHVVSGHYYALYLGNTVEKIVSNAGFGSATSYVTFDRRNYVEYQVRANTGTVAGVITLEFSNYFSSEPIEIDVLDSSLNSIEHHTLNIDVYGHFAFNTAKTGTHAIRFKGRHWLSKVMPSVNLNVGQNTLNPTLKNGDIDGDNVVSIFDYIILSDYFDASYLDANWTTVGSNGWAPRDADIDNDNYVTIFDYIYMSNNFDVSGE